MLVKILRLTAFAAVVVLLGCGGGGKYKLAPVKGSVTYKGKPVPNGTVSFIPEGGGPTATGELQKDGTFVLKTEKSNGAVLGSHTVVIAAMQDMGETLPEARNPLPPPIVPEKYTNPATTDLKAKVEDKDNVFTFDLKDDKAKGR